MLDDEFRSIYVVSGQAWKIAVAAVAMLVSVGLTVARWLEVPAVRNFDGWVTAATVILMFGALALASWTVRCPTCGARWVWIAVSERDHRDWLPWALGLEFCPRCGFGSRPYSPQKRLGSDATDAASTSERVR